MKCTDDLTAWRGTLDFGVRHAHSIRWHAVGAQRRASTKSEERERERAELSCGKEKERESRVELWEGERERAELSCERDNGAL